MEKLNLANATKHIVSNLSVGKPFTVSTVSGIISVQIVDDCNPFEPIVVFSDTDVIPEEYQKYLPFGYKFMSVPNFIAFVPNMRLLYDYGRLFYAAEIISRVIFSASLGGEPWQEYIDAHTILILEQHFIKRFDVNDLVFYWQRLFGFERNATRAKRSHMSGFFAERDLVYNMFRERKRHADRILQIAKDFVDAFKEETTIDESFELWSTALIECAKNA